MRYISRDKDGNTGWLLFFYSVPSRPVSSRVKIWRRLAKAGAVQLKGAVYILPMNEEHYEFFQWLVSEVTSLGGESAFTRVASIDSMKDEEIMELFHKHAEAGYQIIDKALYDIETRVNSIRKGSKSQNLKALSEQMVRLTRNYGETLKTDFFASKTGDLLRSRINAMQVAIRGLSGTVSGAKPVVVSSRKPEDYKGKIWTTRKRPFVDRMASAWLIRRFIDRNAVFRLTEGKDLETAGKDHVTFDLSGGIFTHVGDLCTFETLVRSFGLKDKAVRKIAEIVHELDVKDDKYRNPEAAGLDQILSGIRKSTQDDMELLEKGMAIFEMLYISKI